MSGPPSLLRRAELESLSSLRLDGTVLDLGGVKDSSYLHALKGDFSVTTLNMDEKAAPDIFHNLEKPLPIRDGEYDHVLLINVLEHVFEYQALLGEMARVLKKDGSAIIIAPFLYPYHPSPRDFHRFTGEALHRELAKAGFEDIEVVPLGSGLFSVSYLFIDRLLPAFLRFLNYYTFRYAASALDALTQGLARIFGKRYSFDDYPFGFRAVAYKR